MSRTVEWALHLCLLLSELPDGKPVPRRSLAAHYDLPEPYLAKCLKRLVAAGILDAQTGPRGGFRLARPAESITALEVVQAIEDSTPMFVCEEIRRRGRSAATDRECRKECTVSALMRSAEQAWQDRLAASTISDLRDLVPDSAIARNRRTLGRD